MYNFLYINLYIHNNSETSLVIYQLLGSVELLFFTPINFYIESGWEKHENVEFEW